MEESTFSFCDQYHPRELVSTGRVPDGPPDGHIILEQVVFSDEPTGALDTGTSAEVLALLRAMVDEQGQTVVMVTHDPVAASYADRVMVLADGRIVADMPQVGASRIAEHLAALGHRQRAGQVG